LIQRYNSQKPPPKYLLSTHYGEPVDIKEIEDRYGIPDDDDDMTKAVDKVIRRLLAFRRDMKDRGLVFAADGFRNKVSVPMEEFCRL
jgi:hypothetical protein